jgi:hypothetical protein
MMALGLRAKKYSGTAWQGAFTVSVSTVFASLHLGTDQYSRCLRSTSPNTVSVESHIRAYGAFGEEKKNP